MSRIPRAPLLLVLSLSLAACTRSAAPQAPARRADLVVVGGSVVTMDAQRTVLDSGGIAVVDGAIAAVGDAEQIDRDWVGDRRLEAGERDLVIPGLINGHGHAAMSLLRGVADDLALMDWLQNYIFPAEAQTVSPEMVRAGTALAAMEMIRTGTTTFVDMYYFEEEVARVVDETGLRGILGETVIDFPAPDHPDPQDSLEWIRGFLRRWGDHPRVTPAPAPHAPYTVAPDVLQATAALAREMGAPILIHLAETADEVDQIRERYGTTPTDFLSGLGVLGPDLLAAHAIWLDDRDIRLLADSGTGVVHNPESNMKLASGTMRVRELRAAGVPVGLGTDGAASNNDLDMFDALQLAPFLQKHMSRDPTALPAPEVFAMATIEGARALGMEAVIGSLEVGKRADIVILNGDAPALVPRYDPYSHLAYAADGNHVRATVVDGRILYLDGRYETLDPEAVVAAARQQATRIRDALANRH